MRRSMFSIVCTLAVLAVLALRADAAVQPAGWTVESVNADTGAVTAKDAQGKSITVIVDKEVAGTIAAGQTVSIDAANGTMLLTVPVRVQGGARSTASAAGAGTSSGSGTSTGGGTTKTPKADKGGTKTSGTPTVVKSDTVPTASEGDTAIAIRGRPNSSAKEFPNMVGEFSPASENPDGEKDDVIDMSPFVMPGAARTSKTQGTASPMTLSNYPRGSGGADLIDRLAKGLKNKEIDVALLGGQKYMINNCLGIKASAGKFRLKLAKPVAKIDGTGALLQFTIDDLSMTALKVRMRPSTNLNPCTFGGRFEVGGDAHNVRLEIRIDPILDLERCRVAEPGQIRTVVRIGSLNFKGINNELDKVAKNMIEDSVTFALQLAADSRNPATNAEVPAMFFSQLFQTLDDILKVDCPGNPGATVTAANEAGKAATPATADKSGPGEAAATGAKMPGGRGVEAASIGEAGTPFTLVANPALKGRLGRVVIAYPKDAKCDGARYEIYRKGEDKPVQGGYGRGQVELMPGKYTVAVSQKKVSDVEVATRQDTLVKTGVLRLNAGKDTRVEIFDADKKTNLIGGYGTADYGLPVGAYHVQIAGQMEPVTVEDGKVTDF